MSSSKQTSQRDFQNVKQVLKQTNNLSSLKKKSISPEKRAEQQKKGDALNDFDYYNPKNLQDELPQPYKFVDKVLQQTILKGVYNKIFEIEKHKENPNYEGSLKELPPQGSFEFDGITCIQKSANYPQNHVFAGDKYGNVYILDLNKKTQILKKEVTPNKRIINIQAQTIPYADGHLTTLSIISRGESKVSIFRIISSENKLYHSFSVSLTNKDDKLTGNYPLNAILSQYSDFIAISNYKGDVFVYRIPDPPVPILEIFDENLSQQGSGGNNQLSIAGQGNSNNQQQQQVQQPKIVQAQFDKPTQELDKQFYTIPFQGCIQQQSLEELMNKIEDKSIAKLEQENQVQDTKNTKKDAKKGGKDQAVQEEKVEVQQKIEFNENLEFGEFLKNSSGADISEEIKQPKYKPFFNFVYNNIEKLNDDRLFGNVKLVSICVGIIITWRNTKKVYRHLFQANNQFLLPQIIFNQYFNEQQLPATQKKEEETKILNNFQKKIQFSFELLYPISTVAFSENGCFLAAGLKEGTIVIWDLMLDAEKCYLDKHVKEVTQMSFFENWKLISGSQDGVVHIYDIQKGKPIMKRTNLFQSKITYSIINIQVSHSGLAFVIDSLGNLRIYDMWHGEKIGRVICSNQQDSKINGWFISPFSIISAQRDQMCVIAELKPKKIQDSQVGNQSQTQSNNVWEKQTNFQIFKVFDSLINIFQGLSSVFRRGMERDKIVNLFSRISTQELKDPAFEIPNFSLPQNNQNVSQDQRSNSKSKKSKFANSVNQSKKTVVIKQTSPDNRQVVLQNQKSIRQGSQNESSEFDLNSSFKSQNTHASNFKKNNLKQNSSTMGQTQALTKEMLHPEQFLLERAVQPDYQIIVGAKETIDNARIRNQDKILRAEKLAQQSQKMKQELEKQEERRVQEKKKELLKQTKN